MPRRPVPVHARLRTLVTQSGRSVTAVAEEAGLSAEALRQILRGERPNPTVRTVWSVLGALDEKWAALDGDEP